MKYLNLIRWPNLVMIVIAQFVIKYLLFEPFGLPITLNWFGLALLSLATVCLAASGYVCMAIYDMEAQKKADGSMALLIGKGIPIKTASRLFFGLTIVGVLIGFYLSNIIGHRSFTILFILASALLYANASSLRKYVLIGPIVMSFLTGMIILVVGLYDLWPAITDANRETVSTFFSILTDYSIFVFFLNLVHQLIVKQRDVDIDYKLKRKSLSVSLGKARMNKIIFAVLLLPILGVIYYIYFYLYMHSASVIYALVLILLPLFYVLGRSLYAKNRKDYVRMNFLIKLVMVFGFLSIGLYQFILL